MCLGLKVSSGWRMSGKAAAALLVAVAAWVARGRRCATKRGVQEAGRMRRALAWTAAADRTPREGRRRADRAATAEEEIILGRMLGRVVVEGEKAGQACSGRIQVLLYSEELQSRRRIFRRAAARLCVLHHHCKTRQRPRQTHARTCRR